MPPPTPSLVQLSASKALDTIFPLGFTSSDFEKLVAPQQRLLFEQLVADNARLREIEKSWILVKERCPALDLELFVVPPPPAPSPYDMLEPPSDEIREVTEYEKDTRGNERIQMMKSAETSPRYLADHQWEASYFTNLWSWNIIDEHSGMITGSYWWTSPRLNFNQSESKFEPSDSPTSPNAVAARISSQLLLYRLILMFDLPPRGLFEDRREISWEVELTHQEGDGRLYFTDDGGSAVASFSGNDEDAQNDSLELLSFICGRRCMHAGGFPAGTCL